MPSSPRRLWLTALAVLVCASGLFPALAPPAQAAGTTSELFISEYVEGSSNNKAIEIFNGTSATVDLSAYALAFSFNGSAAAGTTIPLTGSLAPGDVHVVVHPSAAAGLLALADQVSTGITAWFNGDDAVALIKGGTVVDSLGQAGFDPGAEWGTGLVSTADNTLRRKADVCSGDTNATDIFDPAGQWDGFATDTFSGLGSHTTTGCTAGGGPTTPPPGPTITQIGAVQGSGSTSPLVGQSVTIEGIVTGDFQVGGFNGFFVQDDGDANPATSDGLFVFRGSAVNAGDRVQVTGSVSEFGGLTEITATTVTVVSTGNALPAAQELTIPVDNPETREGMRVTFPGPLTIIEYFNFDRFGEIVLGTERQDTPTAVVEPGAPAISLAAENAVNRIVLDDGRSSQNPDPARHPNGADFTLTNYFRGGDTLRNVTGVLDFRNSAWKVQPTQGADYSADNPRPAVPDVGGTMKVASFNVLNYFTTLGSRGAQTAEEFTRQQAKIVAAITELDADVVGLIEIENNGTALDNLVAALNDRAGAGTYAAIQTGPIGLDEITVAQVYKPAAVTPLGEVRHYEFGDDRTRPAVLQGYRENATGGRINVVVNHFKSKGSSCAPDDPDTGDGQGNCNLTRVAAAHALTEWMATDPAETDIVSNLIIGDLNSYDHEDPIDVIRGAGYTDLVRSYSGEYAHSYVFDGQKGYLDHALGSQQLRYQVTQVAPWQINADEVDLLDYTMAFKLPAQDALWAPDPYRSSDHDPILIGLRLDGTPPVLDVAVTPTVLWPPNHKYVNVTATVTASDEASPTTTWRLVSVTSNEPDNAPSATDGNTTDDIVVVDPTHFRLRAERDEAGTGRVYTLTYRATDLVGNSTTVSVEVKVPLTR